MHLPLMHVQCISLSPEGWNLLRDAEAILGNVDALNERARRLRAGKAFVLRIGGAASTIERVLPRLIALYRAEWSSAEISITIDSGGKLLDAVGRGELDLAFTRLTTGETIESAPLFPVHVVAVVSKHHRSAPRKSVRVADLAQGSRSCRCTWLNAPWACGPP
ncbi:MAG: LysR substrate-binding domain-containing protein [Burkholderiaceae bacterium]